MSGNPSLQTPAFLHTREAAWQMLTRTWRKWAPPPRMTTREWADQFMYLSADSGAARHGKYRSQVTPWLREIQEAVDDPRIKKLVVMKSAQIGWTVGVVMPYILRRIDLDPAPIVVMVPTMDAAKEFNTEKLIPTVDVTPRLHDKIDVSTTRRSGNRWSFKKFAGGFLKFVGSNSPRSVKSSSAPILIVEEPDDASRDLKGQGDSIRLLEDRAKTHPNAKVIYGGTPTLKGLSSIEWAYLNSDQRKLFVPCPHCGEEHVLDWGNVRWQEDPDQNHEVYGHALPETAFYVCPHCGATWDDHQKNQAVKNACWQATRPFEGVAGYGYLSELYASWDASRMAHLVRRHLQARHKAYAGDTGELVAFWNSVLGLPYEFGEGQLPREELEELAMEYPEGTVPRGGLVLSCGVDVQHNRFAVVVRAWGEREESWLVHASELFGTVTDRTDPVWKDMEHLVFGPFRRETGQEARVLALTIDASDGATNDLVYGWVREMMRRYPCVTIMAGKGSSDRNLEREIFSLPKVVDHRNMNKANRFGLRVYIVGVNKAKDLMLGGESQGGRLRLKGHGPGRFHVYRGVRADYWDHLTAEVKAPSRRHRNKLVWQKKSGRANEFLDCEIYALHAARALKIHTWSPAQWESLEQRIRQTDLFSEPADASLLPARSAPESVQPTVAPDRGHAEAKRRTPARKRAGLGSEDWVL